MHRRQLPCMRLSPLGEVQVEFRREDNGEVEVWLEFNRRNRPNWALIVSDELRDLGSHYANLEAVTVALQGRYPQKPRYGT